MLCAVEPMTNQSDACISLYATPSPNADHDENSSLGLDLGIFRFIEIEER